MLVLLAIHGTSPGLATTPTAAPTVNLGGVSLVMAGAGNNTSQYAPFVVQGSNYLYMFSCRNGMPVSGNLQYRDKLWKETASLSSGVLTMKGDLSVDFASWNARPNPDDEF